MALFFLPFYCTNVNSAGIDLRAFWWEGARNTVLQSVSDPQSLTVFSSDTTIPDFLIPLRSPCAAWWAIRTPLCTPWLAWRTACTVYFPQQRSKKNSQAIYMFAKSRSRKKPNNKTRPTVVAISMFISCLVVEIIQNWRFAFADPLWLCIKVKVIESCMSIYAMYRPTVVPSLNVIA